MCSCMREIYIIAIVIVRIWKVSQTLGFICQGQPASWVCPAPPFPQDKTLVLYSL